MNTPPGAVGSHVTAPGEQLGVRCLAQGHLSRGIEGGYSPTNNPCRTWDSNPQPSVYKSNSLSIRPPACVITSPRDAIRRPLQNCTYNIVCLHYDAIYSFGCFILLLWNLQVQLIICTCIPTMAVLKLFICRQTVDQCREWILFAKCGEKSYHDSNIVI